MDACEAFEHSLNELKGIIASSQEGDGVTDDEWRQLANHYERCIGQGLGADAETLANDIVFFAFGDSSQENQPVAEMLKQQFLAKEKGVENNSTDSAHNNIDKGADPVMLFNGQFVHEVDDIHINGAGIDFIFKRTYKNQTIFNGPLGYNWTHNFHIWLRVGNRVIFRSTGDLREEPFTRHPFFDEASLENGGFDYWMPPDGKHGVITAENNTFVLRQPNGSRQIFEPDPRHSFLHRLSKVEDRFGNYLHLHYDEDQQLSQVDINHSKKVVAFEYDDLGRICLIRDYTGRVWAYTYDSIGDLIAVTSPSTDRYDCGLTVNYHYSSAFQTGALQHNLTRIIDAAGQIYLETEYGTSNGLLNFNRVVRQRQGGGEYRFEYEEIDQAFDDEYPDIQRPMHQTILVERNGQPARHIYNKFGNLLMRDQCVIEKGIQRTLVEQYRYNLDGNVVSSLTPEGVFTQHLFGRDFFTRKNPLTENGDVPKDSLTWKERQAFGRILATTRRGGYASFDSFTLAQGIWGNFPNILDGDFPETMLDPSQDIIVKMTYEDEFGQLLTVSDPRYTNNANPEDLEEPKEHRHHKKTRTKYTYTGIKQLLSQIEHPQPGIRDGQPGPIVQELFTSYDPQGRLLRSVNPVGVVTELSYFDDETELSYGHLHQSVIDVGGFEITVRNAVDDLGRVTAVHLPKSIGVADGRFVTRTVYNELDQVIETTSSDPFNFKVQNFYDRTGKLEKVETDLRDEIGQPELGGSTVTNFCYDEEFNLVETTIGGINLDAHLVTKHRYDNTGKEILTILPNGNQIRTRYDERKLPISQIIGAGSEDAATTRIEYDGDGRVRRSFDALGNPTTFDFDTFGRAIATENALGHITRTNYDKGSNITCIRVFEKRPDGYFLLSRSETAYDELNRVIRNAENRFDDPVGPFPLNKLDTAMLDSLGPDGLVETTTFYDANSRIIKTVDPLERETHFEYDKLDRSTIVTDPLGNQNLIHYDDHNNIIRSDQIDRVLAEDGAEISKRFFASSSTFDELDRRTSTTDSLGNITRLFYDSRGNIVRQVDPLSNEQRFTFDIFNRPISSSSFLTATGIGPVTDGDISVTTQQEYDFNNNLISVIDALGRKTRYEYDALDRRRAIIYPDASSMLTDYDKNSNVIRTQDNNGLQRFYTVDALNRTTRVDVNTNNLSAALTVGGATFEHYEYDGLDRQIVADNNFALCIFRFNSLSWLLQETITYSVYQAPLKTPFTITRQFNDIGALTELTYPNGRIIRIDRDELNRRTITQNIANGIDYQGDPASLDFRPIAQMTYAGRQRDQCLFANGASATYQHDSGRRLIEINHSGPDAPQLTIQYLYDAASNVRVRNDVLEAGPRTERFAYDSLYRLAHEIKPDSTETFDFSNMRVSNVELANPIANRQAAMTNMIGSLELPQIPTTYDYDLVGNREIERPEVGNEIDYSNNSLDQCISRGTTSYLHDDTGNLKNDQQRFSNYDSRNRLVHVSADKAGGNKIAEFWHDALGRRILEQIGGNITQLICDGNDVIAEYRDDGLFAQYVFDDGIDRPLHISAEGEEHWYHADLVGSIRLLTNADDDSPDEYRYTPFGALIEAPDNDIFNPWRYTARRFDVDLESYDYRARQYDPQVSRFLQRDQLEMVDGTNLYSYTNSSPLAKNDPKGRNSRTEHHHSNPLDWDSLKEAYNKTSIPKKPIDFIYDTTSNNTLGFGLSLIANTDSSWSSTFGKISTWLGPIGMYSNYETVENPEQEMDVVFGSYGLISSSIGTAGLLGSGLNSLGMTAMAKPLLVAASRLNPIGLATGAFAGGGLFGQYLDDKAGLSNKLSARAKGNRDILHDTWTGETAGTALGAISTVPLVSDAGEGIGWVSARLVLGITDNNYTCWPWKSAWWSEN